MDAEALEATRATGLAHFHSRSRGELWQKGATSGNTLEVATLAFDCDGDTLLLRVRPAGPACHTGEETCFGPRRGDVTSVLPELARHVRAAAAEAGDESYVAGCWPPAASVAQRKVGEEAVEVLLAPRGQRRAGRRGRRPVVPLDGAAGARRDRPAGTAGRAAKPPEVACAP